MPVLNICSPEMCNTACELPKKTRMKKKEEYGRERQSASQTTGSPVIAIMKAAAGGQGFKGLVESQDVTDHLKRLFTPSSHIGIYDLFDNTRPVQYTLLGPSGLSDSERKKKHMHPGEEKSPPHNSDSHLSFFLGFIIVYMMWTDAAHGTRATLANALIHRRMTSKGVIYMVYQYVVEKRI